VNGNATAESIVSNFYTGSGGMPGGMLTDAWSSGMICSSVGRDVVVVGKHR
jgi:hypothetical protein